MNIAIDAVLRAMHPKVYYRPTDSAEALGVQPKVASKALRSLYRGCVVERCKSGRQFVYLSWQQQLPL